MSAFILVTKIASDRRGNSTNGNDPVAINVDAIRAFYARHEGRPGTRITFTDGGGFAVSETPQHLAAAIAAVMGRGVRPVEFPEPAPRVALTDGSPVARLAPADEENDDVA